MDVLRVGSLRTLMVLQAIRHLGGSATCPEIVAVLRRCDPDAVNELTGTSGKYGSLHNRLRKALANGTVSRTENNDRRRGRPGLSHVYHLSEAAYELLDQWVCVQRTLGVYDDQKVPKDGPLVCGHSETPARRETHQPQALRREQHEAFGDGGGAADPPGTDGGDPWGVYQPDDS